MLNEKQLVFNSAFSVPIFIVSNNALEQNLFIPAG